MKTEQKHAWIYLFNLGFYILPMFLFPYAAWQIALMLGVMALFVLLYFRCYRVSIDRILWPLLGMYLIACAITPLNSGSIALFSYVGFFITFAYRLRFAIPLVLGVLITLAVFHFSNAVHWDLFLHYGVVIVATVSVFGRVERLRQQHRAEELRSEAEIERLATTVERERIARDLHDILGHTLSSIILKSDLAQKQLHKKHYADAAQQLQELSEIARASLSQVRQSVSGYKHGGLQLELGRLEQRLRDAGFETQMQGPLPTLDNERETTIVLALTELITNIIRHSAGQRCEIRFSEHEDTFAIAVKDDGKCDNIVVGNGLNGVRERIDGIGGEIEINAREGCLVAMRFPKLGVSTT